MHRRIRAARIPAVAGVALLAALAATAGTTAATAAPAPAPHPQPGQQVEYFTEPGGHPHHTTVPAPHTPAHPLLPWVKGDGKVTSVVNNGRVGDKLDVVFVGDGYTASQQNAFHAAVRAKWKKMTAVEPYASYRNLFNVWAVDAVSHDSGVSGDPDQSVKRDTALGSGFFCEGVERLLCLDTAKVESYAAKAPAADLVVVLSNSTKYGGAGYNDVVSKVGYDGIATASADNEKSDQIAVHETGHSLGKLADEYEYAEYGTYTGTEPATSNISTLGSAQMADRRTKWYRWLGQTSPDGGTVGTYEGGGYYPKGLFRPTDNSIMRSLGREFNSPGREAMIAGFYRHAKVLSSTRSTGTKVGRGERLTVLPASASTTVRWYVDGHEVTAARGKTSLTPRSLGVRADGRAHTVTVKAADRTSAVRDPELAKKLTGELAWKVR